MSEKTAVPGALPLAGVRVVEFAALGPLAHAGLMLASMGASIDRIDRAGAGDNEQESSRRNVLNRGRRSIALDLKSDDGRAEAQAMMARADVVLEGHRPGVMERLMLGPDEACAQNPRLVYARMSGWGQGGPRAQEPGHDINFLAASGLLDAIGTSTSGPVPPLMLVGDFGGGGMSLAYSVVCALFERERSGRGQVIEAGIHESAMSLGSFLFGAMAADRWNEARGTNAYDTGAHFYNVYQTRDNRWLSVGAVEPPFYAALLEVLSLDPRDTPQWERDRWPELKARLGQIIAAQDLAHWEAAFSGVAACVEPVLTVTEAARDPRFVATGSIVDTPMGPLPRPVPRFSRSPEANLATAPEIDQHSAVIRAELGDHKEESV